MFSTTSKHSRTSSESAGKKKVKPTLALSVSPRSSRMPAIDMRTTDDVPTLACIELSKSIMKRPEVNTGSLFSTIAASRNSVNKSDAVITIAAAILKTIGNHRASELMLNKSKTVHEFYKSMRLDDETMRTSFVIMLFAIAPEFVKMIETSVKTSLERVQAITDAPHADNKLLIATGELAKDNIINSLEYSSMLNDVKNNTMILPDRTTSIQNTPSDVIGFSDSVSQQGDKEVHKSDSPMTAIGLMRYVKRNPGTASENFYKEHPTAKRPVEVVNRPKNHGLGFTAPASAVMDDITETNFSAVMNDLLPSRDKTERKRHSLSRKEKQMFVRPRSDSVVNSSDKSIYNSAYEDLMTMKEPIETVVTREDIENDRKFKTNSSLGMSALNTQITDDNSYLLDLL